MSSDFGLRGPKTPWVCPNDRQLALRAKLKAGWSVKTNQFNTYPKPAPLTEKEQQAIVSVVKKAEEMEMYEQHRVGKLVDRLESLRRLASGNGITECVLCGDSFGLSVFGRTSYRCSDCKKAVCRKCVVDLSTTTASGGTTKETILRLCKLCAENREFIKKSGAWFYKGVPKYILPEKKNHYSNSLGTVSPNTASAYQEKRYMSRYVSSQVPNLSSSANKRSGGVFWSKSIANRSQSEPDNESSSGDETSVKPPSTSPRASSSSACDKYLTKRFNSVDRKFSRTASSASGTGVAALAAATGSLDVSVSEALLYEISDPSSSQGSSGLQQKSFERFDPTDPFRLLGDNNSRSAGSTTADSGPPPQSTPNSQPNNSTPQSLPQESPLGTIELSLLYDDTHQTLHCSIVRAKELTPTDINGLSDPYCILKLVPTRLEGTQLRSKTVPRTLHPVFNETLSFYGITNSDLTVQTLQINVMDEDKWGKDCLGSGQIPLHGIKPQQTRFFTLSLERARYVRNSEDKEWSRGRLLLSLSYVTEKSTLLIGIMRAQDLPALDHGGTSDPFVKVRLVYDSERVGSSYFSINKKFKTSVKWKTLNPEFREEFSLKVSSLDLPKLTIAISVWDKDLGKHNDYIGGILLSSASKGERLKHWTDMMKFHNTKHLKWHILSSCPMPH